MCYSFIIVTHSYVYIVFRVINHVQILCTHETTTNTHEHTASKHITKIFMYTWTCTKAYQIRA